MSVTVVSCVYGTRGFERFRSAWLASLDALERQPEARIMEGDGTVYASTGARSAASTWRHPQAWFLQRAITEADTDWVWILDIDDTALPDALNGIDDVTADVWATGYIRSDGEVFIAPQVTAADILNSPKNLLAAGSCIRTEAFRACGGFLDVALQDWALWRALARNGATFESSGRANFRYNRHPYTRGEIELTVKNRPEHFLEMLHAEEVVRAVA